MITFETDQPTALSNPFRPYVRPEWRPDVYRPMQFETDGAAMIKIVGRFGDQFEWRDLYTVERTEAGGAVAHILISAPEMRIEISGADAPVRVAICAAKYS